jgi:hypothetical protein
MAKKKIKIKKKKTKSEKFWDEAKKITKGIKIKSVRFRRKDFDLDSAYE